MWKNIHIYVHTCMHTYIDIHTYKYTLLVQVISAKICRELVKISSYLPRRKVRFSRQVRGKLHTMYTLLYLLKFELYKYQFSSVTQSCLTLCNPMGYSTPGFPVHHLLLELAQTHMHQVGDAIQPSHPLSSPSPPAPNPSQHQGLFQ